MNSNTLNDYSENEKRCAAIVANLPGVILQLALDPDGSFRYLFLNARCENTLGITSESLYANSTNFIDIILPEDRTSYLVSMQESAQKLSHWTWEGRIIVGHSAKQPVDIKWIHLRAAPRKLTDAMTDSTVIWEGIITNITERKQSDVEIYQYRQRLTELSAHIERIKEQERMRIAREIHDEMGGNLVAAKMILHTLENRLPPDQPWLTEKAQYIDTLIDRTIEAGHRIARDLRPGVLDLGIIPALEWQVKEFEKQYSIRCAFSTNKSDISLRPEYATALFRMTQEALTNIAKHANATYANLVIIYTRTSISLTITDNGCGLKPGHNNKPNSFGLLGMAERCKEIGGTIVIDSHPESEEGAEGGEKEQKSGCVVAIKIPLNEQSINGDLPQDVPTHEQLSLL